jgi:hypothetical protein
VSDKVGCPNIEFASCQDALFKLWLREKQSAVAESAFWTNFITDPQQLAAVNSNLDQRLVRPTFHFLSSAGVG